MYTDYYGALWSSILFRCMQPHVYFYLIYFVCFICFQSDRGVPAVPRDPVVQDADLLQKRALHAERRLHQTSPRPVPHARDRSVALPIYAESGKRARHSLHFQHHWWQYPVQWSPSL